MDKEVPVDSTGWDARYAASDQVWGGQPNRFVADEFTGLPPGRALDLGAGEGRNAIWLAGWGWQVTAVDFSPVAIERGRRLAQQQQISVDWVVADVREYQPEPDAYDAVIVSYLHLPVDERATVLSRAADALRPGGRALVVGHDLLNLAEGVGGPQDPAILYTPQAIADELTGLTVRSAYRVRRRVESPDGTADAIDTLVVAFRPDGDGGR